MSFQETKMFIVYINKTSNGVGESYIEDLTNNETKSFEVKMDKNVRGVGISNTMSSLPNNFESSMNVSTTQPLAIGRSILPLDSSNSSINSEENNTLLDFETEVTGGPDDSVKQTTG